MREIEDVLRFWFEECTPEQWFTKDDGFDARVREKLLPLHEAAVAGKLEDWRETARGCLALVILMDQVPRNVFRDTPRAFASDGLARAVCRHAIEKGLDQTLPQVQRLFLYLPLEHSEELRDQEDCCGLMKQLDEKPEWHDYAVAHRDIVARFGRFPHRNAILGRDSTPQEAEFLTQEGSSF